MCSPLDFLASQLFGHLGNFFVFAHVEPASRLVLNAHLRKLRDVLDEAVPGGMLQNFARETHVSTQRAHTQLGHLVGQLLQKLIQHLVVDAEHIRLAEKGQDVFVVAQLHVVVTDLGQLASVQLGQFTVHQHLGCLGESHNFCGVDLDGQAFKIATPYAYGDVVVKALGRFQRIPLDFSLGGALEDVALGVIPDPPVAGSRDLEDHQLAWVPWNSRDGFLDGHRPVPFV